MAAPGAAWAGLSDGWSCVRVIPLSNALIVSSRLVASDSQLNSGGGANSARSGSGISVLAPGPAGRPVFAAGHMVDWAFASVPASTAAAAIIAAANRIGRIEKSPYLRTQQPLAVMRRATHSARSPCRNWGIAVAVVALSGTHAPEIHQPPERNIGSPRPSLGVAELCA